MNPTYNLLCTECIAPLCEECGNPLGLNYKEDETICEHCKGEKRQKIANETHRSLKKRNDDSDPDDSEGRKDNDRPPRRSTRINPSTRSQSPLRHIVNSAKESSTKYNHRNRNFKPIITTKAQYKRAELAKKLHKSMGHPSLQRLISTIDSGKLTNCPLTAIDVRRAVELFGECDACIAAKSSVPKALPSDSQPAERAGEFVHVDIIFIKGKGGKKGKVVIAVDGYSGFIYLVDLRSLTKADVTEAMERYPTSLSIRPRIRSGPS